jgi:hypothetical protein
MSKSMDKVKEIQAKARELARSGDFYGWLPIKLVTARRANGSTAQRLGKSLIAFAGSRERKTSTADRAMRRATRYC